MPENFSALLRFVRDFVSVPISQSSFFLFCVESLLLVLVLVVLGVLLVLVFGFLSFFSQKPRLVMWTLLVTPLMYLLFVVMGVMEKLAPTKQRRQRHAHVRGLLKDILR